jgi:hypothetical protein
MTKQIGRISRYLMITLMSLTILVASAFPAAQPSLGDSGANPAADSTNGPDLIEANGPGAANDSGAQAYSDDSSSRSARQTSAPPAVHGTWCGSMDDNHFGTANVSMDISQRGSKLSGTWTSSLNRSGTLKGKIAGSTVTLTLQEQGTACRAAVNGTLVQSDEITGTYTIFGCHQSDGGTFDVTNTNC